MTEVVKSRIKMLLLSLIFIFPIMILLEIKVYAINVPIDTIYATSTDTGYWGVGKESEWTCSSSNSKIVKVWKRENRVYYQALNPGTAYIQIHNKAPIYTASRKIIVKKPAKSDLSVKGVKKTAAGEEELIVDFTRTWSVKSKYGWRVYSPDIGIIKVTNIDKNNGKITYVAKNQGKTYIKIIENYTERVVSVNINVIPYVRTMQVEGYHSALAGYSQQLSARTAPLNYVGKAGYGSVGWSSSNTNIAIVNQSGKVKFLSAGDVRITVTYSDGLHKFAVKAWVDYKVGKPSSDLTIQRNTDGNIIRDNSESIIDGFTRTWTIKSKYGWSAYTPPNAGIIGLMEVNGNKLTYKALSSEKKINSGYEKGNTYITITENYTGVQKTFWIKVYPHVTDIKITNKNQNFKIGSTYEIKARTLPYDYTNKLGFGSITWSTSDQYVAVVDKKGNVTIKGYGTVTITVTYKAGSVKKSDSLIISNENPVLKVAEEIHTYMDTVGYAYKENKTPTFEETKAKNGQKTVVCSTYVGWVLKELGLLKKDLNLNDCKLLEEALMDPKGLNWKKIPGNKINLQPGDIIIYGYEPEANGTQHRNHADIYVGNGKKLSAGHALGPNSGYGHYDNFEKQKIKGNLEEGWDRYWVYRPTL